MSTHEIIRCLRNYNAWRRGDDEETEEPKPRTVGRVIDEACTRLGELETERDRLRADSARFAWLVENGLPSEHYPEPISYPAYCEYILDGKAYDSLREAVDAGMKADKKGGAK